jgi:hypothetical protein
MSPSAQQGRAAVVSRHPATIRRVAQSLGAVGLGVNHSLNTAALKHYEPAELKVAVIDLDVDAKAEPLALVAELTAACPRTPIVAVAGVEAKRRLMAALGSDEVRHVVPKLGGWIDMPVEKRTFDGPDEQDLAIGLRRYLHPQKSPQGVGPYLIEGFSAMHATVGSTADKESALTEVMSMAEALELSDEKKRRIEVATEELLLNAIYDAPRGSDGEPLYHGIDRRTPVALDERARVAISYGCDGRNFVVSVVDGFGAISRDNVVSSLRKMLEPAGPRPVAGTSGAGLGLMLTYSQANQLIVHSGRGRFTEVTAVVHVSGSNRTALARGSALHLYLDGQPEA